MNIPRACAISASALSLCACVGGDELWPGTTAVEVAAAEVAPIETPVAHHSWPTAKSCPSLLQDVLAMVENNELPDRMQAAPLAILPMGLDAEAIGSDFPLPVIGRSEADAYPCLLLAQRVSEPVTETRRVLRSAKLRSTFPKGTRRTVNPERRKLEKALSAARWRREDNDEIASTGDPTLDLVGLVVGGVIDGVASFWKKDEIAELEAQLDEAPAFIEEPVLTPYSYKLTELDISRVTGLEVTIYDTERQLAWTNDVIHREVLEVALSDDRHPDDPTIQHSRSRRLMTSTELDAWEHRVPVPSAGEIVRLATDAVRNPPAIIDMARLLTAPIQVAAADIAPAAGADPAAPSRQPRVLASDRRAVVTSEEEPKTRTLRSATAAELVRIGKEGSSVAFHLSSEQLIAPLDGLSTSSLVQLQYPDGEQALGLVEKRDDERGIALVYSPKPGLVLPLATDLGTEVTDPPAIRVPGTPIIEGESVRAIWLGHGEIVEARDIDELRHSSVP